MIPRLPNDHAFLAAIIERSPDACLLTSADGRIIDFNAAAETLFERHRDAVLGRPFQETILPAAYRRWHQHMLDGEPTPHSGMTSAVGRTIDTQIETPSGERVSVELSVRRLATPEGTFYVAYFHDLRRRQAIERDRELALARLGEAQRIAGLGDWSLDLKSRRLDCSDNVARLLGHVPPLKQPLRTFVPAIVPEERASLRDSLKGFLRRQGRTVALPQVLRVTVVRANGEHARLELRTKSFGDARADMIYGTVQDVTDDERVQSELRAAVEQAERAANAKTAFLAMMSHEIRTPMHGILGTLQLLADETLSPAAAVYVRTAQSSGEALLSILNDVLDVSKMEAGALALEPAPFELSALVDSVVSLHAGQAAAKDLAFCVNLPADVPAWFEGDAGRLRQMLHNLVSNAVKFTDAGRVCIDVERKEPMSEGPARLQFAVTDTGVGIAADRLPDLFQEFRQVAEGSQNRLDGTGLGLAIVKRLAVQMGGDVGVRSELGQGSTFSFTVRLPRTTAPKEVVAAPVADPVEPAMAPMRILLAEDNATNRLIAEAMLRRLGHQVVAAGDGQKALEALAAEPFDLVLMDIHMPHLDGVQATQRLREQGSSIPIIALTANAMREDIEAYLAAGMDACVIKPMTAGDLKSAIRQVLEGRGHKEAAKEIAAGSALLDEAGLNAMAADFGDGLVADLIRGFRQDLNRYEVQLVNLGAEPRAKQLAPIAHGLKGCAQACHAIALAKASAETEALCRSSDSAIVSEQARRLKGLIAATQAEATRWDQRCCGG